MTAISDVKKAYRLLRKALASRSLAQRVRSRAVAHADGRFQIAVYFADPAVNMYQMRQWYQPLKGIADRWPVVVLSRSASGAAALQDDGELPVAYVPKIRQLERYLAGQDIRLVLYVNQNTRNFQMFRYGERWHVFINHGESDKVYMSSNQFKAYDYALIAGQAARERLSRALWDFDVDRRTLTIGRPQADHFAGTVPWQPDGRTVVLYAPTWEGDRASMSYGSVRSHGLTLVQQLVATGEHRVIYRPHPRTGVVDLAYEAAHKKIVAMLKAANAADPAAHHVFDDGPAMGWQLAAADVAIVDISAMIYDRLATGKPLMITRPVNDEARIDMNGYLSDCEWLTADAAADVVAEVERVRRDEAAVARLRMWAEHYYGDTTPGVATEKFRTGIEQLMQKWDDWHARGIGTLRPDEDDDDDEVTDEDV